MSHIGKNNAASSKSVKKDDDNGHTDKNESKDDKGLLDKKDIWKCLGCKKEFSNVSCKLLECERCTGHYCIRCTKFSEQEYDFMSIRPDLHWFCTTCDSKAMESVMSDKDLEAKLNTYMDKFNQKMDELSKELKDKVDKKEFEDRISKHASKNNEVIGNLKAEISDLKKSDIGIKSEMNDMKRITNDIETRLSVAIEAKLLDTIEKKIEEQSTSIKGSITDESWSTIITKEVDKKLGTVQSEVAKVQDSLKETQAMAAEERDREARRNNIVIYNMLESNATIKSDRDKFDFDLCMELINEVLNIHCESSEIKNIFRFGIKRENLIRPILIEFRNRGKKNMILESLYKLKSADQKFKKLSITHDMTKLEREEMKQLVREAKEKQNNLSVQEQGEWMYRVRGLQGSMKVTKLRLRKADMH
jgi:hypothetical protein